MTGSIAPAIDRLLSDPGWRRLLAAARRKLERTSGELIGTIGLDDPTDAERRVVIGITGRHRSADVRTLRVDVTELDQALGDYCGAGLLAVLARQGGPVRDRAAERAGEAEKRTEALARVRSRCPRHRDEQWFTTWLDGLAEDGTLTRLVRRGEAHHLAWAAQVLNHLPEAGVPLPVLAERATGNTKALTGTPLATLVLRALALRAGVPAPTGRAEARARWEAAGVIVDDLASQILVLNLRAQGDHVVARWLRDAADAGIPFRLTLHQLTLAPIAPIAGDI
ncbi:MAG: TIGR02679 domain-containing protein, partial [Pseudonocardiaceae bacterium]